MESRAAGGHAHVPSLSSQLRGRELVLNPFTMSSFNYSNTHSIITRGYSVPVPQPQPPQPAQPQSLQLLQQMQRSSYPIVGTNFNGSVNSTIMQLPVIPQQSSNPHLFLPPSPLPRGSNPIIQRTLMHAHMHRSSDLLNSNPPPQRAGPRVSQTTPVYLPLAISAAYPTHSDQYVGLLMDHEAETDVPVTALR
jgi:hypothetical protein